MAKKRNHISTKLLLSYLALISVTLLAFTLFTTSTYSKTIILQTENSINQLLDQTDSYLTFKLEYVINTATVIAMDQTLNNMISRNPLEMRLIDQIADIDDLEVLLGSFNPFGIIENITLYVNPGFYWSQEGHRFKGLDEAIEAPWYAEFSHMRRRIYWANYMNEADQPSFSLIRNIVDLDDSRKILGIVKIDLSLADLKSMLRRALVNQSSSSALINGEGQIVLQEGDLDGSALLKGLSLTGDRRTWELRDINGEAYFTGLRDLDLTPWSIATFTHYDDAMSQNRRLRNGLLVFVIVVGSFSYVLSFLFSRNIINRMNILIREMRKVQKGDFSVELENFGRDEIGEIAEDFNFMINRVSDLMKEKYQSGLDLKGAELKALQAQINPHFLYNTLELINCSAMENQIPHISEIVRKLARFYKLSLSGGREIVSLKDELEHVNTYVQLQNLRFDNAVKFIIDVPEELLAVNVPKILFQPLVENALIHGILMKPEKTGTISLLGRGKKDGILFTLTDDGTGMEMERLSHLFEVSAKDPLKGYGIKNIRDRLKLTYGEKSYIDFESFPGSGTVVNIYIPGSG
ncbi:MAG: sensor histidine kinase [Spirochaetales bacterium]|nr:sensor histidine kinase [Spirochaetales bacterium]